MILVGNQRGGARDLATHLLKPDNERVEVHELRGFVSRTLEGAFQESRAISRATACKQHLYSLSLNPPRDAAVSIEAFEKAVETVEERLGLKGQPRAIVFHEKCGTDGRMRRHAHAVWCRIDRQALKAVQLSHDRRQLQDIARGLYFEHGWKMPLGFVSTQWRDPRNFSLAEWQQAKRVGKDPKVLKALFQERWAISDSRASFSRALEDQGFVLARGDRRGFVAVDHDGAAYPISRWTGVKSEQVQARLDGPNLLPSVEEAHAKAAGMTAARLQVIRDEHTRETAQAQEAAAQERKRQLEAQKEEREQLQKRQAERHATELLKQAARIRTGLFGLLDCLTGRRRSMLARNRADSEQARMRDKDEYAALRAAQERARRSFEDGAAEQDACRRATDDEIRKDIEWLKTPFNTLSNHLLKPNDKQPEIRRNRRNGPEPNR